MSAFENFQIYFCNAEISLVQRIDGERRVNLMNIQISSASASFLCTFSKS